ncbi:hypothetical protein [uncultured Imperialibacter sp.]
MGLIGSNSSTYSEGMNNAGVGTVEDTEQEPSDIGCLLGEAPFLSIHSPS